MENVTGIILAGGKSQRMGSDKGLMHINGKPMIQYIIDVLYSLEIPVLIVSNNKQYELFGIPVFGDAIKGKGPMAGIYTGLLHSKTTRNLVLSCDIPRISSTLIYKLIRNTSENDISIIKHGNTLHPLIGIYKKSALVNLKHYLDKDKLKLNQFCLDTGCTIIEIDNEHDIDSNTLENINTKEQLEQLQK